MPKKYNTLRERVEALKEGKTLLTRKAARGIRSRGKRGKRLDEERAYRGGFMADGKRVVLIDPGAPEGDVTVVIGVGTSEESPMEKAARLTRTLILSGVEPRVAIMRAATAHKVAPRELALIIAGGVSGTNVVYGVPVRP